MKATCTRRQALLCSQRSDEIYSMLERESRSFPSTRHVKVDRFWTLRWRVSKARLDLLTSQWTRNRTEQIRADILHRHLTRTPPHLNLMLHVAQHYNKQPHDWLFVRSELELREFVKWKLLKYVKPLLLCIVKMSQRFLLNFCHITCTQRTHTAVQPLPCSALTHTRAKKAWVTGNPRFNLQMPVWQLGQINPIMCSLESFHSPI